MRIILGVTGCIAAYKAAVVLRQLQQAGCDVFPVMTSSACHFVTPLTFEKLSGHRVVTDLFQDQTPEIEHIALARRSDLLLVAPATANILAKFAHGIADDFLSTLYVSTVTPVVVAPAMNVEMWKHPSTRHNLEVLRGRGVKVVEPGAGYLACGEVGEGRLAEPEVIVEASLGVLGQSNSLRGQTVLVSAGPTVEDIDPVRFVSNRSSGRMGYAVAEEARRRGAQVILVTGPTSLDPPFGVELVRVRTAEQMRVAVTQAFEKADIVVMAAAVADYRPAEVNSQKIKKSGAALDLHLVATADILFELGARKQGQFLVGFAAESEHLVENALGKLRRKNLDLVVANDISLQGQGFEAETNRVLIVGASGEVSDSGLLPKFQVAALLWDRIEKDRRAATAAAN